MDKKEISNRVKNILTKKEENSLTDILKKYSNKTNDDWIDDLNDIEFNNPVIGHVVEKNQLPQINTKEMDKIISKLAEQITTQREIEFIEMNGNMLQDMLINHNYGQFFNTSKSLEIRLDNTLEDKIVKIRYRR